MEDCSSMEIENSNKTVLIVAPSDRKFRVDLKSNSSQSDLELLKLSFDNICLKDFALKQIVDSSNDHFIFKTFDPLFKCEVEITYEDVIEHGSVLHVTIVSSVSENSNKLPESSYANSENGHLVKTEESILPLTEYQASTSKATVNIHSANKAKIDELKGKICDLEQKLSAANEKNKELNMLLDEKNAQQSNVEEMAQALAAKALNHSLVLLKSGTLQTTQNATYDIVTDEMIICPAQLEEVPDEMVEFPQESVAFVTEQQKTMTLALGQFDPIAAKQKATEWDRKMKTLIGMPKKDQRRFKRNLGLPPIYTEKGDLYMGPYDPLKLIRVLLRQKFTDEELSNMCAGGTRVAKGGAKKVPGHILEGILGFVHKHCPNALISKRMINEAINSACSYSRKRTRTIKENKQQEDDEYEVVTSEEEF